MIDSARRKHPAAALRRRRRARPAAARQPGSTPSSCPTWSTTPGTSRPCSADCSRFCHSGTRIVLNFYSRLWEVPLKAAAQAGLARPVAQAELADRGRRGESAAPQRLPGHQDVAGSAVSAAVAGHRAALQSRDGAAAGHPPPGAVELHPRPAGGQGRPGAASRACTVVVAGAQRGGQRPGDLRARAGDGLRAPS